METILKKARFRKGKALLLSQEQGNTLATHFELDIPKESLFAHGESGFRLQAIEEGGFNLWYLGETEIVRKSMMSPTQLWDAMMVGMDVSYEEMKQGKRSIYWQAFALAIEDLGPGPGPDFTTIKKGTKIRVVMASRFGTLGITECLGHDRGYTLCLDARDIPIEVIELFDAANTIAGKM